MKWQVFMVLWSVLKSFKSQVTYFRTFSFSNVFQDQTSFTFNILSYICINYVLKFYFVFYKVLLLLIFYIILIFCFNFVNDFSCGGAFRAQSNSCVGAILRKELAAFGRGLCLQKSFIVGFQLGLKYAPAFYIFLTNQSSSFYTSLYFYNTLFSRFPQQSYC